MSQSLLFNILLVLHIVGGAVGLICGTINLLRRKAGKAHRLVGHAFVYGLLTAGFSALVLACMHPNQFLFIVGVFTVYMVATGKRYMRLKNLLKGQRPALIDWVPTVGMGVTGLVFAGLGIRLLIGGNMFGIVFLAFAYFGLSFVRTDVRHFRGRAKEKNYWLLAHLQRMTGGYIAAFTAFLVVNMDYLPGFIPPAVVWLLPTAVLTPMIVSWSRKYRVKLDTDQHASPPARG